MIQFKDGPAFNVVLDLRQLPLFLRVVTAGPGKWDALDQLDDEPRPGELIHAYRLKAPPLAGFLDYTEKGRRKGRSFLSASYVYVDPQPADAVLRDTAGWREWTTAEQKKLREAP